MAIRGQRPTIVALRGVRGKDLRPEDEDSIVETPECPAYFEETRRKLWDRYIRRCHWLTVIDEPKSIMWVNLFREYEGNPDKMPAPRIHQLRCLGTELGLDPVSRSRPKGGLSGSGARKKKDPLNKYV